MALVDIKFDIAIGDLKRKLPYSFDSVTIACHTNINSVLCVSGKGPSRLTT